jgi:hypothetical protein
MTSPALAVANHLYDSYNNHTLSSYTDTLVKDFQDSSILTLQSDPNVEINNQQDDYEQSKTSSNPVEDGSCMCECHLYDQAIAEGKIPPQSLGLIPRMENPSNLIEAPKTNQPLNPSVKNAVDNDIQTPGQGDLDTNVLTESQMIDMDRSEFMDAVNESLDRQRKKNTRKESISCRRNIPCLQTNKIKKEIL